jgi:hypothetical protein
MTETAEQKMARENLILEVEVGSHLYGTFTEDSDHDYAGIFVPNEDYVLGMLTCEQVEYKTNNSGSGKRNDKDDIDKTIHSLPKFLKLAADCNPNIIELLFASKYIHLNLFGSALVKNRRKFISQRVLKTFLGYAHSQKEKLLVKKDRLDAIRAARKALQTCHRGIAPITNDANIAERIEVKGKSTTYRIFEKGLPVCLVARHLRELEEEYGLRTKSIEEFGFDTKFALHLIRLLYEGIALLNGLDLVFPLPKEQLDVLMAIRRGEWKLEKIISTADSLMKQAQEIKSPLPWDCDRKWLNDFQVSMLKEFWGKQ